MAAADRDLLFGLLALQNGLIDQAALVAAFQAWTRDKSRPLADHHAALGHLDAEGRAAVEAMVALHLKKHGGDAERSLAAVGGVGSLRDDLQHIADPELHATLDRIVADGPATARDPEATMTVGVAPAAAAGSRFSILRPHARGGLGQVSVARDAELNREVALKELRPERADDPSSRARFLLEAEVTGRLEHPGVVPVYGLGCDARGRPFYAMRLVKGETLKEAIEHFHARQAAAGGGVRPWNLALRQLLSRFVAVCNVVAYAHSRGVIHRDLKPANILLGPYAETLVVDWGLAKVVGRGESARSVGAAEATLQPASGSGSSETLPGTALGTPAYMSPEQAEGRLERTGPASDVYSLGATLYCLLTGRPPLEETDVAAVLRKIQRGEIVPPRRVDGRVPAGLEAICRKAMAVDPGDRYPTPRALADEIEHWLADEPVSVYREPVSTRLTRWGRRHRTLATGLGVLLITAVAGLSIATALIRREQLQTEAQRLQAEANALEAGRRAEDLRRKDYINRVNLAHREVLDDNIARAADLLEGCPVDLRNWEWRYVRRLCHLERLTYRGHFENVRCLAISPDGTWVASGACGPWSVADDPSEVRIWDLQTGRERHVFPDLPGTVQAVAFSPDGTRVAAGGGFDNPRAGGWLKVWDAASGELVWNKPVPGTTVMSLAFHPDGRSLAVADGLRWDPKHAGHVQLFRVTDGAPLGDPFGELAGGVNAVAFDRDGRRLALAGFGRIEVWDVETRAMVEPPLMGHTKWVYCVAFHPDGEHLASGGWDNTIQLWDLATGAAIQTIPGHRGFVEGIAFNRDGTQLASASEDNSVQLWEVPTGRPLAAFHGHTDRVHALAFHPDGRRILTGSVDGTVKVWDVFTSRSVIFRGHSDLVRSVEFLDNDHVVSRDKDYSPLSSPSTKVWHVATGEEVRPPPPRTHDGPGGITDPQARGRSLSRLSPDGTLFAKVKYGPGLEVEVRRPSDGRLAFTLQGHTSQVSDVVFSPDGDADRDGQLRRHRQALGRGDRPGGPDVAGAHGGGPVCRVQPRRDEARLGGP